MHFIYLQKLCTFDIESRPTTIYGQIEFWITALDKGIYRFDKNQKLHHFKFDPLNPFSIATSNLNRPLELNLHDNQGKVCGNRKTVFD